MIPTYYLKLLALTIVVEWAVVMLLARKAERRRLKVDAVLVNLATHPFAYLAIQNLGMNFFLVEFLVVVVEAVAYRKITRLTWGRATLLSLVSNAVTILLSLVDPIVKNL